MNTVILLLCFQFTVYHVYCQCPNRVVQGPNGPIELLPNQVLVPPGPYLGPIVPPGTPQGRPVLIGPSQPKANQPIILSANNQAIPAEYANLGPVIANIAPTPTPNNGNVIVPNPQGNYLVPNVQGSVLNTANVFVPNVQGNYLVPNVAGNYIVPNVPGNNVAPNLPGNVVVPNAQGNYLVPNVPSSVLPNLANIVTSKAARVMPVGETPAVIHDSSVANSLANALQLLVVSSLLSNTLPPPYEPCYEPYLPGYNYIY